MKTIFKVTDVKTERRYYTDSYERAEWILSMLCDRNYCNNISKMTVDDDESMNAEKFANLRSEIIRLQAFVDAIPEIREEKIRKLDELVNQVEKVKYVLEDWM